MSFSGEQKAAIAAVFIKSVCCRRAHMQGILAARAELEGERLRISTDSAASAEYIATLAEGLYSVKPAPSKISCFSFFILREASLKVFIASKSPFIAFIAAEAPIFESSLSSAKSLGNFA